MDAFPDSQACPMNDEAGKCLLESQDQSRNFLASSPIVHDKRLKRQATMEKRKHPRLERAIPTSLEGEMVRAVDISGGGALLDLEAPLAEGSEMSLEFDLEKGWRIRARARVLRSRPVFWGRRCLVAVQFLWLNGQDRHHLPIWVTKELTFLAA